MLEKQEYNCWSYIIKDAWHHGLANMTQEVLDKYGEFILNDLEGSFLRPSDVPAVRPSGNLHCAGLTWLVAQGKVSPESLSSNSRVLFATGHFQHNLLYAALECALPANAFKVTVEEEIDLELPWWPKDHPYFKQRGHVDLQIECTDPEWLAEGVPSRMLFDAKTKHNKGMSELKREITAATDLFGNINQLAIYAAVLGYTEGAMLVYINREAPSASAKVAAIDCRHIFPDALDEALANTKRRVEAAAKGVDFDPELWRRKQEGDLKWVPCDLYCAAVDACKELRT